MGPNHYLWEELKQTRVIIWDEAPMAQRYHLEALDRGCRDITGVPLPFGGKVVVLGGDFRQCCPVNKGSSRAQLIAISLKRSPLWQLFTTLKLTTNMRALPEEIAFKEWTLRLGDGILHTDEPETVEIPERCFTERGVVEQVFGPPPIASDNNLHQRVILTPLNDFALRMNDEVVDKLQGDIFMARGIDRIDSEGTSFRTPFHRYKFHAHGLIVILNQLFSLLIQAIIWGSSLWNSSIL